MPKKNRTLLAATSAFLMLASGATAVSAILPHPLEANVPPTLATSQEYGHTLEFVKKGRPQWAALS